MQNSRQSTAIPNPAAHRQKSKKITIPARNTIHAIFSRCSISSHAPPTASAGHPSVDQESTPYPNLAGDHVGCSTLLTRLARLES